MISKNHILLTILLTIPLILFFIKSNIIIFDDNIFINDFLINYNTELKYEIYFDNKTINGFEKVFNDFFYYNDNLNINSKKDDNKNLNNKANDSSLIFCSFYDFESPIFKNYNANKTLIIGEYDNIDNNSTRNLKQNHIDFDYTDYSRYLMHNKYCISKNYLITGSTNPTNNGIYKNNNNLILFEFNNSKPIKIFNKKIYFIDKLQFIYLQNFIATIKNKSFNYIPKKIIYKNLNVTACFSPYNNCQNLIINNIKKTKLINVMAFSFTDKNIFYALNNSNIIIEKSKRSRYTIDKIDIRKIEFFDKKFKTKIKIFNDTNKYNMHNKLFISNKFVILGSYNPTGNAQNNYENILIIENNNVSKRYNNYFNNILNFSSNN